MNESALCLDCSRFGRFDDDSRLVWREAEDRNATEDDTLHPIDNPHTRCIGCARTAGQL